VGVILDWVPAHFPKDPHGLARFDGTALYEHADPRQGEHMDWGTLIFNFGRNEVRNFLIANALFWLEEYHVDGLRVDAVASMLYLDYSRKEGEWLPNRFGGRENLEAIDFVKQLNQACYEAHPGIMTIAEESTAFTAVSRPVDAGGLGFGFKWNMGWMHDFLLFMSREPVHRKYHHGEATFAMIYAYHENYMLVLSHDEVVHGKRSLLSKMPGDRWQQFANLRMFFGWMFAHPGKKLLFQGSELAPSDEWNHDQSLDWHLVHHVEHESIQTLVRDLNALYVNEPALHELDHHPEGFEWIDHLDSENSVFSFLRRGQRGKEVLIVVNATPVSRGDFRLGVPKQGLYEEIFNSDASRYGGSNFGSAGGTHSEEIGWHGRECSIRIKLPPLACVMFRLREF
jgi:1,4-alpha-glucan branching enzyme